MDIISMKVLQIQTIALTLCDVCLSDAVKSKFSPPLSHRVYSSSPPSSTMFSIALRGGFFRRVKKSLRSGDIFLRVNVDKSGFFVATVYVQI